MSLNQKQAEFFYTLAKLVVWAKEKHDIDLIGAELFRTDEQAAIYAKQGKGIKNSVHRKKLACDMFACINGKVSWDRVWYEILGEKWKKMDTRCRWGGDFKGRDRVHFSFEHNGVK